MLTNTPTQIAATTLGFEQWIKSIYQREFGNRFQTELDFYEAHVYFVTLTFKPNKVSLHDAGLSKRKCFYSKLIRDRDAEWLKSKSVNALRDFANQLGIDNANGKGRRKLISDVARCIATKQRSPIIVKPHPRQVFYFFHRTITKACLKNFTRKPHLQPFALVWVDFEGTRQGLCVDPLTSNWPHIHALIFVREGQRNLFSAEMRFWRDKFRPEKTDVELEQLDKVATCRALTNAEQLRRLQMQAIVATRTNTPSRGDLRAVHDLEFARYDRDEGPMCELVGYAKKGNDKVAVQFVQKGNRWREAEHAGANDLYEIFPLQLNAA